MGKVKVFYKYKQHKRNKASISQRKRFSKTVSVPTSEFPSSTSGTQLNYDNIPSNVNTTDLQPSCSTSGIEMEIVNKNNSSSSFEKINDLSQNHTTSDSIPKSNNILCSTPTNDELNFSFISEQEYKSVMEHELCIEKEKKSDEPVILGNRIVDLNYVLNRTLSMQHEHSKVCSVGKLSVIEEDNRGSGLVSTVTLKCTFCPKMYKFQTEDPKKNESHINVGAVWGTLASGSTYGKMEELFSLMNIRSMPYYMFQNIEKSLGNSWKDSLYIEMEKAGKEELQYAIDNGDIDKDGKPFITVYVDGGWSKRSYLHSYNAQSGVGIIIGRATKKVLFVGIRNKYCSICSRAANKQILPREHICFRNWSGSSSAMESDIIVQGFNLSEEMHGLRYNRFIGDGDSSVYARIREKVSYGQNVEKIECTNHAVKNYGKALIGLKKDTDINIEARRLLTQDKIKKLQDIVQLAIYNNACGDIEMLKTDLRNGLHHIFQDHSKCKAYYCNEIGEVNDEIHAVKSTGLFNYVKSALDRLIILKSNKLISNETNNAAECFMSIMCRFNCGKRLNLTQRGSYEMRSYLASLRYNKGPEWQLSPWKRALKESPGQHVKKFIAKEMKTKQKRTAKRCLFPNEEKKEKRRKSVSLPTVPNIEYGKMALQVEIDETVMEAECKRKLTEMQVTAEEQNQIAIKTIGQFDNQEYINQRMNRLTASNFGRVIKRLDYTPCDGLVKIILKDQISNKLDTPAIRFGKTHEQTAIKMFEEMKEKENNPIKVDKCGLYIDKQHCFLAATPDGLIYNNALVEVKCLYTVSKSGVSLKEFIKNKKNKNHNICIEENKDGNLVLKKRHDYYYQIQGQLNICERQLCYFIVFTGIDKDLYVEEIKRDSELWENEMLPKLKFFYLNCVLPEVIRGNRFRKQKCIDPPYIRKAIEEQNAKKEKKKQM